MDQQARLEQEFNLTIYHRSPDANTAAFSQILAHADGMIGYNMATRSDKTFLANTANLNVASTISVVFDNYDLDALKIHGVRFIHSPKVLTEATADLIFTLLMATARRTVELSNLIHERKWEKSIAAEYYGTNVYGKTIGYFN